MVGLAAKSAYLYYLDAALKAGAKGHYDYITLHPYEILGTVIAHPGTEPIFLTIASKVRKMLAAQDPGKVNVPPAQAAHVTPAHSRTRGGGN